MGAMQVTRSHGASGHGSSRLLYTDSQEAFGETHVHTTWSFDGYVFSNTKAGLEDAYIAVLASF